MWCWTLASSLGSHEWQIFSPHLRGWAFPAMPKLQPLLIETTCMHDTHIVLALRVLQNCIVKLSKKVLTQRGWRQSETQETSSGEVRCKTFLSKNNKCSCVMIAFIHWALTRLIGEQHFCWSLQNTSSLLFICYPCLCHRDAHSVAWVLNIFKNIRENLIFLSK